MLAWTRSDGLPIIGQSTVSAKNFRPIRDDRRRFGIAIDFTDGRTNYGQDAFRELSRTESSFVEEPVLIENEEAFAELRLLPASVSLSERSAGAPKPCCKGLCRYSARPGPCGRHSGVRRIAPMAEACDVAIAPHIRWAGCARKLPTGWTFPPSTPAFGSRAWAWRTQGSGCPAIFQTGSSNTKADSSDFAESGARRKSTKASVREIATAGHDWKNRSYLWRTVLLRVVKT